ncbi:hypothetical protein BKA62DRAFT_710747 [Auriculariales sp. MPI-PUGE-AT-0066]|nr:hypothetical protein BKA62DRAFT_710747 [Auriculariales sp. MPI-PUGE-AT-0066]
MDFAANDVVRTALRVEANARVPPQPPHEASLMNDVKRLRREEASLPMYSSHRKNQKRIARNADEDTERNWYRNMRGVLNEVDWEVCNATGFAALPTSTASPFNFLDLGCCPGGFSSYILEKNPNAVGVGVSLPEGHRYLLPEESPDLTARHTILWLDLVRLMLSSEPAHVAQLGTKSRLHLSAPPSILLQPESFGLVVLDGHPLSVQRPEENPENGVQLLGPRLLVSQLIIALTSVCTGGTLLVKLVGVQRDDVQRVICMLDALSDTLVLCKPTTMFATQDSFYVLARGIRDHGIAAGKMFTKAGILMDLRALWTQMTLGGSSRGSRWDFICTQQEFLQYYRARYDVLTAPVLKVLCEALKGKLNVERNGGL